MTWYTGDGARVGRPVCHGDGTPGSGARVFAGLVVVSVGFGG